MHGSALERLATKLKKVHTALKLRNQHVFDQVDQTISLLEDRLAQLDEKLQNDYCVETKQAYIITKNELECWEQWEEIQVGLLAKNKWLKEANQNSKFFHTVVNKH